jgi:excisionase family DNA binding protein
MAKDIEVYTLKEIQDLLQVTRRTLYNWIKDGKLKAFRIGKEWRVTKEALEEFTKIGTGE